MMYLRCPFAFYKYIRQIYAFINATEIYRNQFELDPGLLHVVTWTIISYQYNLRWNKNVHIYRIIGFFQFIWTLSILRQTTDLDYETIVHKWSMTAICVSNNLLCTHFWTYAPDVVFVSFGFFVPLENFIWRLQHCRWRAANLWLMLGTHGHWTVRVLSSVHHLVSDGVSVYNVHLRELMALTLIAERFAVELSQLVLTSYVCRGLDSNTQSSACEANVLTHGAIAAIAGCECAK